MAMHTQVRDLSFSYGRQPVLRNISFEASGGELLSILGPNGTGKSTLFRCILGLLPLKSGTILLDGELLSRLTPAQLSQKMAYIPQTRAPAFSLRVLDTVLMGTAGQTGLFGVPGASQHRRAEEAMAAVGISHLAQRGLDTLSGGEQQLVYIARALAQQAKILLMDEPDASLDLGNRIRIMDTLRALTREGYCVILSTHDPELAYLYSHRILALHGGSILALDTPEQVITREHISRLYQTDVEICSLRGDTVRVCIPKNIS